MVYRHPKFPLLEAYWDNKHQACHIVEQGAVSVHVWFYVFY
jgi:hypothetical protein